MIDILISQVDEHNESNILATKELNPEIIYFIKDKSCNNKADTLKKYYERNFKNIKLNFFDIKEGDNTALEKLIKNIENKNIIVNLTGGKRVNSLILLNLCLKNNLKSLYIDIKEKILYEFKDNAISILNKSFEDLEIDDIVKASGGMIVEDASQLYNKKDLIFFSEQISKNISLWHEHKQKLYDSSIFEHDSYNQQRIYIHTNNLSKEENKLLNLILDNLVKMKEITVRNTTDKITIDFLNNYLKAFIFKSGTWLEIETNKLINKIDEIDESKNGVMFLWNDSNEIVRNEVDVVAVKDSVPIFISCKDSDKYNEMALNELNVYAEKFGGDNSYKILVATKAPIKSPVKIRAKEMGINIIIFDGNEEKFLKTIFKNIISILYFTLTFLLFSHPY